MVRGITSASVIPTASEGEGGDHASVEENTVSVAELESKKYLQAAFQGQISTEQPNPDNLSSAIPTDSPMEINDAGAKVQQQKPAPRQRSQSAVVQKSNTTELTKNYLDLVRDFRQLQPFTRRPDGSYPTGTLCVYCVNTRPTSVFFPCQHMCVCDGCIKSGNISTDYSSSMDWCACPVCMTDIRLILPHSGKEEERYWRWALEIKPTLPPRFKQEFKEAGKRLNKSVTPTGGSRSPLESTFRRKSNPLETPKTPSPKSKFLVTGRRHSWQSGEVTTDQHVVASNEHDEARHCSIL
ncbi:hypothetical protein F442_17805 [Phytophthora nicotianae P10297]|uniref:RING-type domain-containing protein n=3 Tax=Phytophthora nicotianae TaxID=4792 RepID=W2R0U1_PHYN3|nr:hypothetical protein PPTG_04337 [Phytophthora nicotianae INRA-310]ETL82669.1 hypothetical protein L917_17210 [Phytophthora nicotianae]ETM35916.1 hypothetical protein L914_17274 [Phytophthora nicotianae]ETN18871.1 hypothetical protein PPTG_04337 [Phytophthora nicotianae INRA-310]ETP33721.1 hypothetical protein F442_17805 [Phytophthora nicotianae P10297]